MAGMVQLSHTDGRVVRVETYDRVVDDQAMDAHASIFSERVLLPSGLTPATVHMSGDGRIEGIEVGHVAGSTRVRGLLSPGLIDLQVNGKLDVDVWGALSTRDTAALGRLDGLLIDEGVTTWLPTLVTQRLDRYRPALEFLWDRAPHLVTSVPGAHLEGPMLGARPGAHRPELIAAPTSSWWDDVAPFVRLVTIGAESVAASEVAESLVARGVAVSIGHSSPTRQQFDDMVRAGATMVTHLFNAMSGVHHRDDSLALWALNHPRVVCGLIADGVHVDPAAVDLAIRAARGGVALVTDAVAHLARIAGPVTLSSVEGSVVDGAPRLADGTLAGSCLTMTGALGNAMRWSGVGPCDVLRSATEIPARVLGLEDRGEIAVGRRADLVSFDLSDDGVFSVDAVWAAGRRVR